ncbi:MAG: hypothetical protein QXT77_10045 [Candidatus Methanomethylicaceae archaeon]
MKRALAVLLAFVGFSAFGIGTFSGKWDFSFCTVGGITSNSISISYADFGWTFTGLLSLKGLSTDYFKFTAKGGLGPLTLTGNMFFDFNPPDYNQADLTASLDLAGMSLSLKVEHWSIDDFTGTFCPQTPSQGVLRYTLKAVVKPITLQARYIDCCTGTAFYDVTLTLEGLSLCCGITYDVEFSFTKEGFKYVGFSLNDFINLCCGISLDAYVEFGVNYKHIEVTPKFAGVEACFTVYGDVSFSGGSNSSTGGQPSDLIVNGLIIDGWLIKCELTDCSFIEFMSALSPEWFYVDSAGKIWHRPTSAEIKVYGLQALFNKNCGEFEYIKLAVCGAGCCGGTYTVALSVFFGGNGALFDITKFSGSAKIPVMANFTLNLSYSYAICPTPSSSNICFGWTFSFWPRS